MAAPTATARAAGPRQLALGIVSCVAGIPVTAISLAVDGGGLAAMVVGWGGLIGINAAHALQSRPTRARPEVR